MPAGNQYFDYALIAFRLLIAGILAAHGWARLMADGVVPFGQFLDAQGFPLGFYIAAIITAYEIVGTLVLASGRLVASLSLGYAGIYCMGIVLVHAPEGWFVVGLGRNGAEYSVLLIASLLLLTARHWHSDTLIGKLGGRRDQ